MGLTRLERMRRETEREHMRANIESYVLEAESVGVEPGAIFESILHATGDPRLEVLTLQALRAYDRSGVRGLVQYLATADIPDELRTPETVQKIKRAITEGR